MTTSVRSHNNHRTSNGKGGRGGAGEGGLVGVCLCVLSVSVVSVCFFSGPKGLWAPGALSLPGLIEKEWYPLRKWLQMGCPLPEWDPRCKITIIGMHS